MCCWLPWRERKTVFHPVILWTPLLVLEPKLRDIGVNAALKLLSFYLSEFVPHPYGSSSSLQLHFYCHLSSALCGSVPFTENVLFICMTNPCSGWGLDSHFTDRATEVQRG